MYPVDSKNNRHLTFTIIALLIQHFVTNCPLNSSKQPFIFSQLFWVSLLKISHKTAVNRSVSSENLTKNNSLPSSLTYMLAGFICVWGREREGEGTGEGGEVEGEREQGRMRKTDFTVFLQLSLRSCIPSLLLCVCSLLEASHEARPTLRGMGLHRA